MTASRAVAAACAAGHDCAPTVAGGKMEALSVTAAFQASADQVRCARDFAARMLDGWPTADDAVLCVSELATNAVLHSASRQAGGKFWVHLETFAGRLVSVQVRDQGGSWAYRSGRDSRLHGLDIVRHLAMDFGIDGDPQSGWIVWARLDVPESEGC